MDPTVFVLAMMAVPFSFMILALRDATRQADIGDHTSVAAAGAEALGLEPRERGWGGRTDPELELELTGASEGRMTGERITVKARLIRPIATAFVVHTRKTGASTDVQVGADFDQRFVVRTDRDERVRRLLKTRLGYELVVADGFGYRVDLSAEGVSLTARWITQIGEVRSLAATATKLAKLLLAAERAQPELLPWRHVTAAWTEAAERVGGRFDGEARVLEFETPAGTFLARPSTEREEHWFGEVSLRLRAPLPATFALSDERGRSLWQRAMTRELELGDRDFDRAFFVQADDGDLLRAMLDADLRRALLDLERKTGTLSIDASGFEARFEGASVTDARVLGDVLAAALSAGEALARAGAPASRGAYR